MAIEIAAQTLRMTGVTKLVASVIADLESGGYVRTLQVFGSPLEGSTDAPLIATLVLESDVRTGIEILNPEPVSF
jgi:hypothetical protein